MIQKIIDKILRIICRSFNRDDITFAPIVKRSDLIGLGSEYGGWVVPSELIKSDSICYCAGCGEDITFDLGLIDRFGCDVYGFDPTPRAITHIQSVAGDNNKYHFTDVGLWDKPDTLRFYVPKNEAHVSHSLVNLQKTEDYIEVKVETLLDLMQVNGHTYLDLLKLDIEGAEYKVLESIISDNIDIKVICVEFDECFNPLDRHYRKRVREAIKSLMAVGYKLVCIQDKGNYTFVKA